MISRSFRLRLWSWVCVGALSLAWMGCGSREDHAGHDHDHGHAHQPKNGGILVELGDHQYHLELLREASSGRMTAWVLDAHAENYVRVPNASIELTVNVDGADQVLVLKPVASAATGEREGETSQFEGQADWLRERDQFQARLGELPIRRRNYTGWVFEYPSGKVVSRP